MLVMVFCGAHGAAPFLDLFGWSAASVACPVTLRPCLPGLIRHVCGATLDSEGFGPDAPWFRSC